MIILDEIRFRWIHPFSFVWRTFSSLEFGKPVLNLAAFQIQWRVRAQLSVTAELLLSVCPFFRLLARVHSIGFVLCVQRGGVCGVDRSISRMKDRVNENKWYFQRLFDFDFFFFFFFVSGEYSWMKTKITFSFLKVKKKFKVKHDAWKEKNRLFFESLAQLKLIFVLLLFFFLLTKFCVHIKTRLILNPAFAKFVTN